MRSSVFKLVLLFLVAGLLVIGVKAKVSRSFFSDTESQTANTISTATSFEPPTADHVVISEVQIAGSNADDDFIELYNPTNSAINLAGSRLVKRTSSGATDTDIKVFGSSDSIPAHGYYLWCNTGLNSLLSCDAQSTDTLSNHNSFALRYGPRDSGTIIDAVTLGSPAHPLGEGTALSAPPAGSSVERKALSTSTAATMGVGGADEFKGNGFDSNNNSTDFILRSVSQPQNSGSPIEIP